MNTTRKATECSVEGCERGGYMTKGLCRTHYARYLRHGDAGGAELQHSVSNAGKTCKVNRCSNPVNSRDLCTAHYKRLLKYGDPEGRPARQPIEERFWSKVDRRGPNECWPWLAGITSSTGYGMFHPHKGESTTAHRFAYELAHGLGSASGLVVDHTCHNGTGCPPGPCPHRMCCNPTHLEAVENAENVNRSHNGNASKTHCPRGHAYTPDNTRWHHKPNTIGRSCKTCAREQAAARSARKRAA